MLGVRGFSQSTGTNVLIQVPTPYFQESNLTEDDPHKAFVYLPPSYYTDTLKRYPVVFYLDGFGSSSGYFNGYMNNLISTGKVKEMIVVSPASQSKLVGSFYVNSPVTGNWDDFITVDIVKYLDTNYRTIPNSNARAIGGHSMGGFGALNLSMLHPDVFCIGYGISPGLFNDKGLSSSQILTINARNAYLNFVESVKGLDKAAAHEKYLQAIRTTLNPEIFTIAYGSAFAPDPNGIAPYIHFPYSKNGTQWVLDSVNFKKFDNGFGNLKEKIKTYKSNLQQLKSYVIDFGNRDEYGWIIAGCRYYHEQLTEAGIDHTFYEYQGTHSSALDSRIREYFLPLCSQKLDSDTAHFSTGCTLTGMKISNQIGTTTIDTNAKTANMVVRSSVDLTKVKPLIYISPGAKITPESNVITDFSAGSITYQIVSEDGKNSESWTVTISKETTAANTTEISDGLTLYPNPVSDLLYYNCSEQNATVQVTDLTGRVLIQSLQNKESSLNISSLDKGIYVLNVIGEKRYTPQRFIKE
jgi:enterochelin esterase-like enzyme